jgi:hypothetical protein
LANPSRASYKARVGRYYSRVVHLCEIGEPVAPDVVRELMLESVKLDEIFVYLHERRDPGESLETVARADESQTHARRVAGRRDERREVRALPRDGEGPSATNEACRVRSVESGRHAETQARYRRRKSEANDAALAARMKGR